MTALPVEVPIVIPILQMKKLRLTEGKWVPWLPAVPLGRIMLTSSGLLGLGYLLRGSGDLYAWG